MASILHPMDELGDRALHIDLDVRVHGDEVRGRASTAGRPDRDFTGWLGLIAALDELVEPSAPEPGG
jgi:hypothetical protein